MDSVLEWVGKGDPAAPVVIIGAGRSGSTLLGRMLDAHPDACVRGETSFLTTKLWERLWADRFWLDWQRFVDTQPGSSRDPHPAPDDEIHRQEARVAGIIGRTVAAILDIDRDARAWGFKEIWNGSAAHRHAWEPYDAIFPRATWVHIVRHPAGFAGSCAGWNGDELTPAYLADRLRDWVSIVQHSRARAQTGRFFEVRYENLVAEPRMALGPVLGAMGVEWSPSCAAALDERRLVSQRDPERERALLAELEPVEGAAALATDLGYDPW